MTPSSSAKRHIGSTDAPVSPPPLKRKIQSGTTKNAVANFFTPSSQKPKDKTTWTERGPDDDSTPTLLVGRYDSDPTETEPALKRRKVAAFDLDSTLITSASGKKHADGPGDWKWWHPSVPGKLKELHGQGYRVAILTNQGGLTLHPDPGAKTPKASKDRVPSFKHKCSAVLAQLDIPLSLYAATGKDNYRKPRTGMWKELCADYDLDDVDLEHSIFVGDAGGRVATLKGGDGGVKALPKDFSCSDRNLAHNIGIAFQTPEEFFLGHEARVFSRDFDLADFPLVASEVDFEKKNATDIVLFSGPPGAGKSTFFWTKLKRLGYERVNQDLLKSRPKCIEAATECLKRGQSVAIDNTNADLETRKIWIDLASKFGVPIRCIWFNTPVSVAEHNNAARSLNKALNPEEREAVPGLAFASFKSRFREPRVKEGFQDVTEVKFAFRGTEEEYAIWGRYWL